MENHGDGAKDSGDTKSTKTDLEADRKRETVTNDLSTQGFQTTDMDETVQSQDVSHSSSVSSRRNKNKKHRHKYRHTDADVSGTADGGAASNDDDNDDDGSGSGNTNVVVSSFIQKKRPKSGRHHKHTHSANNGAADDESAIRDASRNKTEAVERNDVNGVDHRHTNTNQQARTRVQDVKDDTKDDTDVVVNDIKSVHEQDADAKKEVATVMHVYSYAMPSETQVDRSTPTSVEDSYEVVKEVKKATRLHKKLGRQKTQYHLERIALKKRLDDTKSKFQQEISKYEEDLSEQRQQYLAQLTALRLHEQYDSLSVRITDLTELENELDKRFEDCLEQQAEIEEIERFLSMREELCKSKESDLIKLDDELDAWRGELDIKKRRLELEDRKGQRNQSAINASFVRPTTDEEDYILKANLRKYQSDLTQADETNIVIKRECREMKKQLESHQLDKRKHEQKIKQLESQLAITLSQLNNKKSDHQGTLPPINGHRMALFHCAEDKTSECSHIMRQRLNSQAQLSINQEAAIRRKLAGKDVGSSTSSSVKSRLQQKDGIRRHQSVSTGSSHSGEGSSMQSPGASVVTGSPKSSPTSSTGMATENDQSAEKSTVCLVM